MRRASARLSQARKRYHSFERDHIGMGDASNARQDVFEAERVHFRARATAQILRDHQFVAEFRGVSRGGLNANIGRYATQNYALYAPATQLQIELRAVERSPLA